MPVIILHQGHLQCWSVTSFGAGDGVWEWAGRGEAAVNEMLIIGALRAWLDDVNGGGPGKSTVTTANSSFARPAW